MYEARIYMTSILEALKATPGMKGCLVVDRDSFILANNMPGGNADDAAVVASQVYGTTVNFGRELKQGATDEVLIESDIGNTLIRNIDRGTLLVAVVDKGASLGFIRMEARKAAEKLRAALYEPTPLDKIPYKAWGEAEKAPEGRAESVAASKTRDIGHVKDVLNVLLKRNRQALLRSYLERHSNDPDFPEVIVQGEPLKSYLERHVSEMEFPEGIIEEEPLMGYFVRHSNDPDFPKGVIVKEEPMVEAPLREASVPEAHSPPSRDSLLKKYRLKDPTANFLRELIASDCTKYKCGDSLEKIKSELVGRIGEEVVDIEIDNQLKALDADPQRLTCIDMQQLVSNLSDFLIAIAGEEEAKVMIKRFSEYIPRHLATP